MWTRKGHVVPIFKKTRLDCAKNKMKNTIQIFASFALLAFMWTSCNNSEKNNDNSSNPIEQSQGPDIVELQSDLLGNYHGVQPSYFLKNQFGDDMVINGNKVPVPSIDFKFLLKEHGVVSLQQTNLEDDSRVYYDGTFKIIKEATELILIECSLSDGQSSNPTYSLTIDKSNKSAICTGKNEPEITLEKVK